VEQDVGPDLDATAVLGGHLAQTQDVVEVQAALAALVGQRLRPAQAVVP
jgi:hypothetical protein